MGSDSPVVAVLGAGGIARPHVDGWAALGAQVRIFSVNGAEELAAATPGAVAVTSIEEAFHGADLVDICTPTTVHPEHVRAAVAAGLDTFCEKPLARTTAEAEALVTLADAAGVRLMPGHVVRWFPAYEALHAAVENDDLGELAVLRFSRTGSRPDRDWFHDVAASGGIVLDQMIHDLDQALWLAGDVVEVTAQQTAPTAQRVTSAQVVLVHASGALSYVTGTWGPPGTQFRTTFEVAGTGGLLQHDSTAQPEVVIDARDVGGSTGLLPPIAGTSPYQLILADFLRWVRGGPQPRLAAADGVAAVRVAEAALRSIASGGTVRLAEGVAA
ncbi:Gfo/Idh/MocA family protein [Pseudactinotalea sp.]|uniref:Gfo/Idh/MocA family protein n=1 Tax=Pseudactinotalea sp. TaxID=1926260 RepID=UPI003B3B987F